LIVGEMSLIVPRKPIAHEARGCNFTRQIMCLIPNGVSCGAVWSPLRLRASIRPPGFPGRQRDHVLSTDDLIALAWSGRDYGAYIGPAQSAATTAASL
jgi:hypothetical protein